MALLTNECSPCICNFWRKGRGCGRSMDCAESTTVAPPFELCVPFTIVTLLLQYLIMFKPILQSWSQHGSRPVELTVIPQVFNDKKLNKSRCQTLPTLVNLCYIHRLTVSQRTGRGGTHVEGIHGGGTHVEGIHGGVTHG